MHLISILIFVIFPFVALAQGSGSTGGTGGAGTTGSVLPAPTGHRQPSAADVRGASGDKDAVQRLQNEKDRIDNRLTGSICSNC